MTRPRFGELLRTWRQARKMSQLDVAGAAGVSTRHLSFLETGRSQPSREMVIALADVLDVPLRERNALLDAAGFAHRYRETGLDAPEMAPVRRSLEFLLARHEPYPAIVCNRRWDVQLANAAATRMIALFVAPDARAMAPPVNVMRLLFAADGLRPHVVNWRELSSVMVQRLHREALAHGDDDARALLDLALGAADAAAPSGSVTRGGAADAAAPSGSVTRGGAADAAAPSGSVTRGGAADAAAPSGSVTRGGAADAAAPPDLDATPAPVVPLHLRRGDVELRLFSALTTLGTAVDVTAQECRLETFFPADAATEERLKALAAPS